MDTSFVLFSCFFFSLNSPPYGVCEGQRGIKTFTKPSIFLSTPFLPKNLLHWSLLLRTYGGKPSVNVFVYTRSGNFFQFSSIMESAQVLKISPNTIRRALKEALPYKGYFFSYTLLEPEFLHNIGFSYLTKLSVNCKSLITWGDPIFLTSSSVTPEFS